MQGAAQESLLGVPKGLLIALACFILVAGSAGAFVAVLHVPLLGSGSPHPGAGSPHAGGTPNVQGSTPHATPCAGSNCTATIPTTTASRHTSLTVTFTGAVSGPLVPTSFGPCGSLKDSQGPYYAFSVLGTLQGKRYIFDIYVRPYHGPGTYTHVTAGGLTYDCRQCSAWWLPLQELPPARDKGSQGRCESHPPLRTQHHRRET